METAIHWSTSEGEVLGKEHPHTPKSMNNLAMVLIDRCQEQEVAKIQAEGRCGDAENFGV